ncbi:hypothetical protein [Serratia odorifera]|uniref:hypothetical protein n=1 Tax=Serratia odorifera TaxID=618 RepID=UPI002362858D|nr:hypothetical protein [Serratia odorifera]
MESTQRSKITIRNNAREYLYLDYWNNHGNKYIKINPQEDSVNDIEERFSFSITPYAPTEENGPQILGLLNGDISLWESTNEFSITLGCGSFQNDSNMPKRYKVKWEIYSDDELVVETEFSRAGSQYGGAKGLYKKTDLSKPIYVIVTLTDN